MQTVTAVSVGVDVAFGVVAAPAVDGPPAGARLVADARLRDLLPPEGPPAGTLADVNWLEPPPDDAGESGARPDERLPPPDGAP